MANGGLGSGWRIARIFGITIRLHASWIVIFVLLAYSLATEILPLSNVAGGGPWWKGEDVEKNVAAYRDANPGVDKAAAYQRFGVDLWPAWHYWVLAVVGTLGLFVCVVAHELSHSIVARGAGIAVEGITLFIFGGAAWLKGEPHRPGDEFRVAVVGPLMSLALGLACGGMYRGFGGVLPPQARTLLFYFFIINVALVIFNLLPGFPLDGGRILRAILWGISGNLRLATTIASICGMVLAGFLVFIGLMEIMLASLTSGAPAFGMGSVWWIVIGLFLWSAARAGSRQMDLRESFAGLTVRDALQENVVTVDAALPLDVLVDRYFYTYRFSRFPVLDNGILAGLVGLKDVRLVPRDQWGLRPVREVMEPIDRATTVYPEEPLADAFRKMMETDEAHLPVVQDGRLAGLVTRHDILALLQIKRDLGERRAAEAH